ncbi:MAG: hypothetical protein KIT22_01440, partial [Verrucomicrobiae bacterium]|nr:hypothetical protein [Verrucomicrobiae bacterium]
MKNILILPLLVSTFIGCKPKDPASSAPPLPEASAPRQGNAPDIAAVSNPAGKWTGKWESKSPQEATVDMELILSKQNEQWKGECRFTLYGNQTSNTRDVHVANGQISFRCDFASDSEFHFTGELTGGQMNGSLEILEHSQ